MFRIYPLLITSWIITVSGGRIYYALQTHFATWFTAPLHIATVFLTHLTGNNQTLRHSSKHRKMELMSIGSVRIEVLTAFCFIWLFFFCLFSSSVLCLCFAFSLNLLDSTTPWQHIRRGFPLSGVWSVSNRLSHTHSLSTVTTLPTYHVLFCFTFPSNLFVCIRWTAISYPRNILSSSEARIGCSIFSCEVVARKHL